MPVRKIKGRTLHRSYLVERNSVDEEKRTVDLSFSSETDEVERWFGVEILDHAPSAVRLDRLRNKGPVLMDHDGRDHVGVVDDVEISQDRRGRAVVRFGRSQRASEVFQDIIDGIRGHVSVGYRTHRMVLQERGDGGAPDVYRVVDWAPYEISMVSVAADDSVGVGRSAADEFEIEIEEPAMEDETEVKPEKTGARAAPTVDITVMEDQVREKELARIRNLESMGDRFASRGGQELARQAVREGHDVNWMREQLLERLPKEDEVGSGDAPASELGLSSLEVRNYSLFKAIRAAVSGNWKDAGFELECSQQIADNLDREARGFFVPQEVQNREMGQGQRVMNVTTGTDLIATDHLAGSFIENLRPNSVVIGLNATVLPGLVGNVDIPKQTGSAAFQWLGDDQDVNDTDPALGSVSLSPNTVAGSVAMSRRLLKQSSPAVEGVIQNDLARGSALAIDIAALEGSGAANQPLGIANQVGVNTQSIAAALGTGFPTWEELVGFETAVADDNALMGTLAYVTTSGINGGLKVTKKDAGSGIYLLENGLANGYPVIISNQLSANRIIYGNWQDVLIGLWGVLDVMPDTAAKAASGGLVLRVFQDVDVAVRHPESFCING